MNNLEKIKLAWSWGWSATQLIEGDPSVIINISPHDDIIVRWLDESRRVGIHKNYAMTFYNYVDCKKWVITGYLYAGELAGHEPIPEGQKFRVKATGEHGFLQMVVQNDLISLNNLNPAIRLFNKSELEPVFD